MATGRIGVTPTLGTRWSKAPAGGTTSLSGLDDNSVSLVYSVGYEAVYRNGVLLSRGNDYTATNGTTITLVDATIAGDIIEVFANQLVPLSDAISKGQFTAKGSLLSATAASTPAVLAVGTDDTVLTADSTAATGLKWATVSAGANWSLVNAGGTALTGAATITVSGITGADKLMILIDAAVSGTATSTHSIRFNSDSATNYAQYGLADTAASTYTATSIIGTTNDFSGIKIDLARTSAINTSSIAAYLLLSGGNSSGTKAFNFAGAGTASGSNTQRQFVGGGMWKNSDTVTSVSVLSSAGNFTGGTIYVYKSA